MKNEAIRIETIHDLLSSFRVLNDGIFVKTLDCYITIDCDSPFYERLNLCIESLKLDGIESEGSLQTFYGNVSVRRNELMFDELIQSNLDPVGVLLQVGVESRRAGRLVSKHILSRIMQMRFQLSESQWRSLGYHLQSNTSLLCNDALVLLFTGYFLGHIQFYDSFFKVHPEYLPFLCVGEDRVDSHATVSLLDHSIGAAIDFAMLLDPKVVITNKELALKPILNRRVPIGIYFFMYFI